MKARLELGQAEIEKAIVEAVERIGWKAGKALITITRGYSDQRDGYSPDTVSASVEVEPKAK